MDIYPLFNGVSNEGKSGIGDPRRAGIRNQSHIISFFENVDDLRCLLHLLRVEITDEFLFNVVFSKEFLCVACVFTCDGMNIFKDFERPDGQIFEVADRGSNDVQFAESGIVHVACVHGYFSQS